MTQLAIQPDPHIHPHSSRITAKFSHFAQKTANWTGHPTAFFLAVAVIVFWIVSGPLFKFSDTWQLVINTSTTIITFLMVFLIQNTQNRDMMAVQLKLSELVLGLKGAKNKYASIEDLSDDELQELHVDCRARTELAERHIEHRIRTGKTNGNGKHKSRGGTAKSRTTAHRARS